jgi:hypothetical protein
MSRGDRSYVLAIITGLGLAFAAGSAVTSLDYHGDYQERYQSYADTPDNAVITAAGGEARIGAPQNKTPCQSPQGHDESDLCAQWRAASGAKEAARWALWQLVFSVFGLIGLGFTLWFNKRAIDLGMEGTKAAGDSVLETRRIGEAQVRCYLSGTTAQVGFTGEGGLMVDCSITNTGQSPAKSVGCRCVFTCNAGEYFHMVTKEDPVHPNFEVDIAAGGEEEISGCLACDLADLHPHEGTKILFTLQVQITAKDVFDLPVAETERFVAFLDALPATNEWVTLKRSAKITRTT